MYSRRQLIWNIGVKHFAEVLLIISNDLYSILSELVRPVRHEISDRFFYTFSLNRQACLKKLLCVPEVSHAGVSGQILPDVRKSLRRLQMNVWTAVIPDRREYGRANNSNSGFVRD